MGIIFDTSVIIEAERGRLNVNRLISGRETETFGLSIISVAELLHGVHRADTESRRLKRSTFVEKIIELFPIHPFDIDTTRVYARLWSDLVKKGLKIGAHDLMIAATAVTLGFSVATFNRRHFNRIQGLELEILE